ncbi:MAG TPA: divalent metal cation transporter [Acidimicrobiales bacterium]|nr:divalent metal cation transporter [Acidimicrobiales bacterium]
MSDPEEAEAEDRGPAQRAAGEVDAGRPAAAAEPGAGGGGARLRRFLSYLALAGPGLIAANAGNDAGGIATYASAGAQFRYRTLLFMVVVTVALVVVQEMSARLGAYTGKGLAALIREEFSVRVAGFALLCLVVANTGLVVSEFAGIGAAMELFHVSRYISIPAFAAAIWAVVVFSSYSYAERVFLLLSLVFLTYPLAALLGHPHWATVANNTVIPHFTADRDFIFLGVALIGTTITPYMQLYGAAGVVDRGIGPDEYRYERIDAVSGVIFANVISMFIIIATATAIGGHGPLTSAKDAALALKPVAGAGAEALFGVGLLGASALAGAVVPLSTSYAVSEALGVERSVSRSFAEAPLFLGLFTVQVVVGAAVALRPGSLFRLLLQTQVLQGVITPVILTFILILANRRSVLGEAVNGPRFRKVAWISVAGAAAFAAVYLGQSLLGLVGLGP